MNLNAIRQQIIDSSQEDWNKITCWGYGSGPGPKRLGAPEHHYTPWYIGLARVVDQFEHAYPIDDILSQIDYVLDEDQPIWPESK